MPLSMKTTTRLAVLVLFVTTVLASAYQSEDSSDKGSGAGAYPYPRAGRGPFATQVSLKDSHRKDNSNEAKYRAYLRIGRAAPVVQPPPAESAEVEKRSVYGVVRTDKNGFPMYTRKHELFRFPRVVKGYTPDYPHMGKREILLFPLEGMNGVLAFPGPLLPPSMRSHKYSRVPVRPLSQLMQSSPEYQREVARLSDLLETILMPRTPFYKRANPSTDSTGMWFGPRLGRSVQSEPADTPTQNQVPKDCDLESDENR